MKIKNILQKINSYPIKIIVSLILLILSNYIKYKTILRTLTILILGSKILEKSLKDKKINKAFPLWISSIILCIIKKTKLSLLTLLILFIEEIIYNTLEKKEKSNLNIFETVIFIISIFITIISCIFKNKTVLYIMVILFIIQNNMLYKLLKIKSEKIIIKQIEDNKIKLNKNLKIKNISKIKNIIFNKTGTLTSGKLRVTNVITENIDEFFYYLNHLEFYKDGNIKDTIYKYRKSKIDKRKIKNYKEYPNGLSATIDKKKVLAGNKYFMKEQNQEIEKIIEQGTIIYLTVDNKYLGAIILSDSIKTKQKNAIDDLKKMKIRNLIIMSGDNSKIVGTIANEYGIKEKYSNVNIDEKKFWLRYIKRNKKGIYAIVDNNKVFSKEDIKVKINGEDNDLNNSDIVIESDDLNKFSFLIKKSIYYDITSKINTIIILISKLLNIFISLRYDNILTFFMIEIITLLICILILERSAIYERYRNFKQL